MLRALKISGFRGLEALEIAGFGPVNLVVGRNGSGKSRLLEAIFAGCFRGDASVFKQLALLRGVPDYLPPSSVAEYFGHFATRGTDEAHLTATFDGVERFNVLRKRPPTAAVASGNDGASGHADASVVETFVIDTHDTAPDESLRSFQHECHVLTNGRYFVPTPPAPQDRRFSLRTAKRLPEGPALARQWGRAEEQGPQVTRPLLECLREVDPAFEDVRVIALDNGMAQLGMRHREHGICPPEFFGDGVLEALHALLHVADAPGGLVLVDEFAAACDARNIDVVVRATVMLAAQLDVQLVVSSHSLEVLDAFLHHTPAASLRILQVPRGSVHAISIVTGDEARTLREQHGFDLRRVA